MIRRYLVTYYSANGTEASIVKATSSKAAIEIARAARANPTRSARWWRARLFIPPLTIVGPITVRTRVA